MTDAAWSMGQALMIGLQIRRSSHTGDEPFNEKKALDELYDDYIRVMTFVVPDRDQHEIMSEVRKRRQ
jgi:hypothetical protein